MVKIEKRQLADFMEVEQTQNLREIYRPLLPQKQRRAMDFLLRNGIAPRKKVNASRATAGWVPDRPYDIGLRRGAASLWDRGSDSGRARTQSGHRDCGKKSGSSTQWNRGGARRPVTFGCFQRALCAARTRRFESAAGGLQREHSGNRIALQRGRDQ